MVSKNFKMKLVKVKDYRNFLSKHNSVTIEDADIELGKHKIKRLQPKNFELESETVWSFKNRGDWATHKGDYRGNWSPYMPRNVILRYSDIGDKVLDQMVGSGTTLVECKLTGRNGVGVDVNPDAVMLTRDRLNFRYNPIDESLPHSRQKTYVGDARNLNLIKDKSIDLIATHPPYGPIIKYSNKENPQDLSNYHNIDKFIREMNSVAKESFRVLKEGKHCAVLIGETRKHQHFIPLAFRTMQSFLDEGFILREDVIKQQWKMKGTRERWGGKYNFLKITHEHLFIFRKPHEGEKTTKFNKSMKWW